MTKTRFEITYLTDGNVVIHTKKYIPINITKINKFGKNTIIDRVLPSTVK